ncbi:MAG: RNA 2',3'-cyclic phosphodiesterase [Candidatus Bathyarchaeia archaeon]
MDKIRCFIAFDLEDALILNKISEIQRILVSSGRLKIVEPENIHITIRFLGEINSVMMDAVINAMEDVTFKPFDVKISGLGAFPNLRKPLVIWAGIGKGAQELKQIFKQVESRLVGLGFKPEPKGFSPHLTIARVRQGFNAPILSSKILELSDVEIGEFRAESLRLKRSVLTPKGPVYSTLHEVKAKSGEV